MKTINRFTATAAIALLAAGSAGAQMFGESDLDYDRFNAGLTESGMYDAWDADADAQLTEGEFATGVFSDWDRDNDMMISEEEYGLGSGRWYGPEYQTAFTDYDADQSGFIEREEFGAGWDGGVFGGWDEDASGALSADEWGTGLYQSADLDQNQVISIEEEGWFEGWFDGDDIEAEIEEVGDVLPAT
jgi:hypothetical protein